MVTVKQKFPYLTDDSLDIESWLTQTKEQYRLNNMDLLHQAAQLAQTNSKGFTTFYGQQCIEQGLEMAEILLDMKLDQTAVAAAIISSALQHTSISIDTVKEALGEPVAKLAAGVMQMNTLNKLQLRKEKARDTIQIDRLRKLFLAMASDIRVVLIKLAERTCIMRGIKHVNPAERKRIAEETMDIYAPLANRLGIGQLKWELEDHAFHYIDPDTYKTIANFLAERRIDRKQRIDTTIHYLKEALATAHIKADITGRAKHIYSIYLKTLRKDLDYQHIYDYSAIRILVPKLSDCYAALSIVHDLFEHVAEEFDDYISHPKPNGYRSIHTAVIGPNDKHLEIQIRTRDMHIEAEHGVAAHWVYKEAKTPQSGYETKITFLRQLLAWHKEIAEHSSTQHNHIHEFLEDNVYVFTPIGDIIDLPLGATPLDFAYHIHSDVGHRCRGAKIKGHIVPLTYQLQTGDQVEIITTPHGTPSRDWLNKELGYLKTSRARAKVAHWFKQHDINQSSEPGKQNLEREQRNTKQTATVDLPSVATIHTKKIPDAQGSLRVAGMSDVLTRIAKCCKPIPGDNIIGYITQGRGISIHRQNCNNLSSYKNLHDNRMVLVTWDNKKSGEQDLPVIDWALGLKLAGNKREVAEEMLHLLTATLTDEVTAIKQLQENNRYAELQQRLHKLHGAVCYCGTPRLKNVIVALESVLKSNKIENLTTLLEQLEFESRLLLRACYPEKS